MPEPTQPASCPGLHDFAECGKEVVSGGTHCAECTARLAKARAIGDLHNRLQTELVELHNCVRSVQHLVRQLLLAKDTHLAGHDSSDLAMALEQIGYHTRHAARIHDGHLERCPDLHLAKLHSAADQEENHQ